MTDRAFRINALRAEIRHLNDTIELWSRLADDGRLAENTRRIAAERAAQATTQHNGAAAALARLLDEKAA